MYANHCGSGDTIFLFTCHSSLLAMFSNSVILRMGNGGGCKEGIRAETK